MVMPPRKPLLIEGESADFFDRLIEDVAPVFELHQIELDFSGFDEFKDLMETCQRRDPETALKIAITCNAWEDYLVDCLGVTQKLLLDSDTTKKSKHAEISLAKDPGRVSNGDRLANCTTELVDIRRNRNAFQSFHDFLKNKIKSVQNGYYLWKKVYELETQVLLYRPKQERSAGQAIQPPSGVYLSPMGEGQRG